MVKMVKLVEGHQLPGVLLLATKVSQMTFLAAMTIMFCIIIPSQAFTETIILYEYDDLDRLVSVSEKRGNTYYGYDDIGNIRMHVISKGDLAGDNDKDGLTNYDEIYVYHINPDNPDTDGDGLTDYEEIYIYHTNPTNPDTDSDGVTDGDEIKSYHTDPSRPDQAFPFILDVSRLDDPRHLLH